MRKVVRRIAAATATVLAGAALPLVATAPAHADTYKCASYLHAHGYTIGPKVSRECNLADSEPGAIGKAAAINSCYIDLLALGVKGQDANTACNLSW
ncbi:hypothetical protein [Streptomyces gilvosporeus]|uniref:hypothetical protein n=1 Tax=Streptomyces gilvosporeus TaxID=553510 RepID=UPI00131BF494|nr:hypothetical protein [Streptomyces gilvosporeus]